MRDEIGAGPKFMADDSAADTRCVCGCLRSMDYHDMATGLCLACWRIWRFSPACADYMDAQLVVEARLRSGGPLP